VRQNFKCFCIFFVLFCLSLSLAKWGLNSSPSPAPVSFKLEAAALQTPAHVVPCSSCCAPASEEEKDVPEPATDASVVYAEIHADFRDWTVRYLAAGDEKAALEADGEKLAAERRAQLAKLIQSDPERALASRVPLAIRASLPPAVQDLLEERVEGRGSYEVVVAMPLPGERPIDPRRTLRIGDKAYQTFVYGRRRTLTTKRCLPVFGIAIDGQLALHERPVRLLEPGESIPVGAKIANPDKVCPVSGRKARGGVIALAGDTVYYLCHNGHIEGVESALMGPEDSLDPEAITGEGPIAQSAWTTGNKTVLYIRVNYPDDLTDPQSLSSCESMFASGDAFFQNNSYGLTSWTWTITPLLTLPQNKAYYAGSAGDSLILSDARIAASTAGYAYLTYNLDCVRFQGAGGGYLGAAYVGYRGCWMKSSSAGVLAHEIGHNYGLWHANFWSASGDSVIGSGSHVEYGDSFDTMGSANAGAYHFNAYEKNRLDWLPTAGVTTITASGTYRMTQFDQASFVSGTIYALKVRKDSDRDYWLDFRQKFTSNAWLMSGVDLHWDPWAKSASGSHLLDTTPGSPSAKSDSAVVIGRTFSDFNAGIHITPIAKGGTSPESLDVVVNIGAFVGNRAPTVSISGPITAATGVGSSYVATALDADGDTLSYYWDLGDNTFGPDAATVTKSWSTAKEYVVRCTVSDRKGGVASDSLVVSVGSPSTFRISGAITYGGQPLQGVRVYVSTSNMTYTDSDGTYTLVALANGAYTVTPVKYGFTFSPANAAVTIDSANLTGVNFTATQALYSISGKVTSSGVGVNGVIVSNGTRTATTNSSGDFTLTSVPNGVYTLTAGKVGVTYNPNGWSNPVAVEGANVTTRNFLEPLYTVSGSITGVSTSGSGVTITVTDGVRVATATKSGTQYNYALYNVPQGTWNLRATASDYTISPSSFTNPVTVSYGGPDLSGKNFGGVAGTTYSVEGQVTLTGVGLPGVVVSSGAKSSTTDSLGKYFIMGLANGAYTLTPAKSGYTFTPVNLAVTLASASQSGKNFTASSTNSPPVIQSSPTAIPNPVGLK